MNRDIASSAKRSASQKIRIDEVDEVEGTCPSIARLSPSTRSQLQEAIQSLPPDERSALVEAQSRVPDLVEQESNPSRYIRFANFDIPAAAQRLAAYWNSRNEIFRERTFLSMNLTGFGALCQNDLEMLSSGSLVILPSNSKGQSVLFADRTKLPSTMIHATETRLRVLFYILSKLVAEQSEAQEKAGLVLLGLMVQPPRTGLDMDYAKRAISMMERAFPLQIDMIHLMSLPSVSGPIPLISSLVNFYVQLMGAAFASRTSIHHGESGEDLLYKLKPHGFVKSGLPPTIGGTWADHKFKQWLKRQIRVEESTCLSSDERLERKRKLNMIHSRQKRERRKIELEVLQDQCSHLQALNNDLKERNEDLEQLLTTAQKEVALVEAYNVFANDRKEKDARKPSPFLRPFRASVAQAPNTPDGSFASNGPCKFEHTSAEEGKGIVRQALQMQQSLLHDCVPFSPSASHKIDPTQVLLSESSPAASIARQALSGRVVPARDIADGQMARSAEAASFKDKASQMSLPFQQDEFQKSKGLLQNAFNFVPSPSARLQSVAASQNVARLDMATAQTTLSFLRNQQPSDPWWMQACLSQLPGASASPSPFLSQQFILTSMPRSNLINGVPFGLPDARRASLPLHYQLSNVSEGGATSSALLSSQRNDSTTLMQPHPMWAGSSAWAQTSGQPKPPPRS